MLPDGFTTPRLILRPIAAQDAPGIFDGYARDPAVTRFLSWRPHSALAETQDYVARCLAASPARSRTYVLFDRADRRLLGAFDLRRPEPHRLDCGYVLGQAYWGRGLMTEALAEISRWALRQRAIWRIGAVCDVENFASARVMQKAGLQCEGILRRWIIHPNLGAAPRDCYGYAKTR